MNSSYQKKKQSVFYIICFLLLFLSFFLNLFKVIPDDMYTEYETFVESLVVGKMAKAEKDGVLASAGFPGVNYDKNLVQDSLVRANVDRVEDMYVRDNIINQFKLEQIKYYQNQEKTPDNYCVYVSHSGGQAMFYYYVQKLLPFDKDVRYQLLRALNCALLALCFLLFIGWVYRNFDFVAALVTFLFIFTSSWLVLFAGNGLWWSLWSFFAPFLTMLLLLEKKHCNPRQVSNVKILSWLFIAFLIKLAFSGLEFISTVMLTPFIPIVYYAWLERWKIKDFIIRSVNAGLVTLGAVVIQFAILIVQLKYLLGDFSAAFQYLSDAFVKRSSFDNSANVYDAGDRFANSDTLSFLWNNIIKDYLRGDMYFWGFAPSSFQFFFAYLIGFIIVMALVLFIITRNSLERKYNAIILSTMLSVACPLSWYVIFKEHSFWHPQIDYIIWYMPFLLLGFTIVGVTLSKLFKRAD